VAAGSAAAGDLVGALAGVDSVAAVSAVVASGADRADSGGTCCIEPLGAVIKF